MPMTEAERKEKVRIRNKEYREKNLDKEKVRIAKWRADNKEHIDLYGIRRKCRDDGLVFGLTGAWLKARLDAGVCEMSGLPFDMVAKRGPYSPSVNRIDPKGDYVPENCRVILWYINRAMSNLGEEFAFMIFEKVFQKRQCQQDPTTSSTPSLATAA